MKIKILTQEENASLDIKPNEYDLEIEIFQKVDIVIFYYRSFTICLYVFVW